MNPHSITNDTKATPIAIIFRRRLGSALRRALRIQLFRTFAVTRNVRLSSGSVEIWRDGRFLNGVSTHDRGGRTVDRMAAYNVCRSCGLPGNVLVGGPG